MDGRCQHGEKARGLFPFPNGVRSGLYCVGCGEIDMSTMKPYAPARSASPAFVQFTFHYSGPSPAVLSRKGACRHADQPGLVREDGTVCAGCGVVVKHPEAPGLTQDPKASDTGPGANKPDGG